MKVVLIRDVRGVGQRDTVKEVADGYALNHLIPNGFAVQATPEKLNSLQKKLKHESTLKVANAKESNEALKKLDGKKITIRVRANEKGHLFKGIQREEIAVALQRDAGSAIRPEFIVGESDAIKDVGEYKFRLLSDEAEATVTVSIEAA